MSKFKHVHIKTDINGKSQNSSKLADKFGSRSTKNQKDKVNSSFEKRTKKINEESDDEDETKIKRFNSQQRRKVKKNKEEIDTPKKGSNSFEKRKVKPKKEKEKKTNEKKKDTKKVNKKKEESDDDESSSSSSSSSSEIVVNKNYKKMKTVVAKDIFKKKVQDIPKKSTKNVKEDKMNVTYNKAKSSLIDEKSSNAKKDKNYLTNKEKTTVVKFSTKKTKKIEDDDDKKKKKKEINGKSADRAGNRKGKSKKDVTKKNNKKKESDSDSLTGSSSESSSITPSSSSYSSEDEKDEKPKPTNLTKSKTNINNPTTKLEEVDKQNQKTEEKKEKPQDQKILENVPNLAALRPPPPDGRKGSIILGTKYLRRRSMDNPYTRERLELLVNQMTLKQNGGNTLFLKNYEPGPTLVKDITHITKDSQTIKKHIKISSCTKAGCKGPGIVKTNQDAFFIKDNFLKNNEYFYIGVCDGHGEFGHVVSNFVINKLPSYIKDLSNESITSAFKKTNKEIYGNTKLDSSMSGTTVVSIVLTPNNILCINLGDSRAALFKYDNGIYYCKNLSRDHKPAEADEARRIDLSGGRIKRCYDEDHKRFVGPERVWMKNKDEPGLAMTRSLGDKIAHNIGVSDEPEFKTFTYDGTEKYIIIASDGLWEYVSGDQCISIVKPFYEEGLDAQEAALALTKEAFRRWKRKEVAIDDITVVVIFFYQ